MAQNSKGKKNKITIGKKQRRAQRRRVRSRRRNLGLLAAVLVVGLRGVLAFRPGPAAEADSETRLNEHSSLGPEAAVVTITESDDLNCPVWPETGVLEQIRAS